MTGFSGHFTILTLVIILSVLPLHVSLHYSCNTVVVCGNCSFTIYSLHQRFGILLFFLFFNFFLNLLNLFNSKKFFLFTFIALFNLCVAFYFSLFFFLLGTYTFTTF